MQANEVINHLTAKFFILIFTHIKLCLAAATHNLGGWKIFFVKFQTKLLQILMFKLSFHSQ